MSGIEEILWEWMMIDRSSFEEDLEASRNYTKHSIPQPSSIFEFLNFKNL